MVTASVVVPVYNKELYLAACLDSIAAQTCPDWECILVDDGSTDQSGIICQQYAQADRRFRVISQPNSGVAAARAKGLEAALGDYVWFLDSDDLAAPDFLESMLDAAEATGAPILVCRVTPFQDQAPKVWGSKQTTVWEGLEASHHLLHDKVIDYGLSNRLFSKKILTLPFFDNGFRYNEDLLTNWYALEAGGKMAFLDYTGYFYRQLEGSASRKGLTVPFITQQWQVAGLILRRCSEDTVKSFYYEKLLYLYSMILRQDNWQEFASLGTVLQKYIREGFSSAMGYRNLSLKMKLVAAMSLLPCQLYRPICRLMLRDRR